MNWDRVRSVERFIIGFCIAGIVLTLMRLGLEKAIWFLSRVRG